MGTVRSTFLRVFNEIFIFIMIACDGCDRTSHQLDPHIGSDIGYYWRQNLHNNPQLYNVDHNLFLVQSSSTSLLRTLTIAIVTPIMWSFNSLCRSSNLLMGCDRVRKA